VLQPSHADLGDCLPHETTEPPSTRMNPLHIELAPRAVAFERSIATQVEEDARRVYWNECWDRY
jgi:hypothetical protein